MWNIIHLYKIGNWCYEKSIPFISVICKFLIRVLFNSAVDPKMKIGKGSYFAYGGIAVVIHKRAVIGNNVIIGQNVTIGGRSKLDGVPVIGNNVYIGVGSVIIGDVKIGNNVVIGANSVVIKNIPDNCVAAGIPAKIIKQNIVYTDYV